MKELCILGYPKCAQWRLQMHRLIWIFPGCKSEYIYIYIYMSISLLGLPTPLLSNAVGDLTFTTLWQNSADDRLMKFSYPPPCPPQKKKKNKKKNRTYASCLLRKCQSLFSDKGIFQNVVCWSFYPSVCQFLKVPPVTYMEHTSSC